jgi:hypothetical protein
LQDSPETTTTLRGKHKVFILYLFLFKLTLPTYYSLFMFLTTHPTSFLVISPFTPAITLSPLLVPSLLVTHAITLSPFTHAITLSPFTHAITLSPFTHAITLSLLLLMSSPILTDTHLHTHPTFYHQSTSSSFFPPCTSFLFSFLCSLLLTLFNSQTHPSSKLPQRSNKGTSHHTNTFF